MRIILGLIMVIFCLLSAEVPTFEKWVKIEDDGQPLYVDKPYPSPLVADWNGDNKKDLIIGDFHGKLRYFENSGTDAKPSFTGFSYMKCDGNIIALENG